MADFDEFIDRLKETTNRVAGTVGKVTKNAVSKVEQKTCEAKLRYSIYEMEKRMQNTFETIGKTVYDCYKSNEECDDFAEMFGRLDALSDELSALKEQLSCECGIDMCPECNAAVNKSDGFCPKCGAKMKNE